MSYLQIDTVALVVDDLCSRMRNMGLFGIAMTTNVFFIQKPTHIFFCDQNCQFIGKCPCNVYHTKFPSTHTLNFTDIQPSRYETPFFIGNQIHHVWLICTNRLIKANNLGVTHDNLIYS